MKGVGPPVWELLWNDRYKGWSCREVEAAAAVGSGFRREWRDSCISNHSDWKYMFWDKAAALAFLQAHYPWYLSTFLSYPKVVLQGTFPPSHESHLCHFCALREGL